ncbi:MAG: helix-turn-helix transcriptional regulator [Clostridia bacterium]|nr:helix-turn-helix transcriptional regulator [Clostridia bacterium]
MNLLSAFKEHKEFKKKMPWSFWQFGPEFRSFTTPPHYAETIEILFFYDVEGDVHIGGQHFTLEGNRVFFVAPNIVHAMNYKECKGIIKTLKINPPQLKPLLDLDTLLEYHGKDYSDLSISIPMEESIQAMPDIFATATDINDVLMIILKFFQVLLAHSNEEENITMPSGGDELREIINWTEENFTRRISLDEVSAVFGYTKHYFCQKFKKATGITYLTYLNNLRISRACRMLKAGQSIGEACDKCGFEDMSYFIQLFKKITGVTPKKYVKELNQNI